MPRALPLGNGSFQINFDGAYRLVDLYYPYVGQDNPAMGHPFRVGVWVEGQCARTDGDEWMRELQVCPMCGNPSLPGRTSERLLHRH